MITLINRIVTAVVDAAIRPLQAASVWVALLAVSLLLALLSLFVFRFCSKQAALRSSRGRMIACLLEFRLFQDDLLGVFKTLGSTLVAGGRYLAQMILPVAVLLVPFGLLLVHLSAWFEYRPLRVGEASLLTVEFVEDVAREEPAIEASDGLEVQTAGFVAPASEEVVWRFAAVRDGGREWIEATAGTVRERKEVVVSERLERVEVARVAGPFWQRLAHPGEPPLPADGPFRALWIDYPRREIACLGRRIHWLAALLGLTIAFGLLLRVPLRIEL